MRFRDRADAGRQLGRRLSGLELHQPVILGLPRGGVPVAAEVAGALGRPFEVFVARKIGTPGHEELGIGAVAEGLDEPVVSGVADRMGVEPSRLQELARAAWEEMERRVCRYRGDRLLPDLAGRDVILVDDGLATGVTAEAALRSLQNRRPARLVLAVPVCARASAQRLSAFADEVVSLVSSADFFAVGEWYDDFRQTTDAEVLELSRRYGPGGGTMGF